MNNNQNLTEPTRKELKKELFKTMCQFTGYTIILMIILFGLIISTNYIIEMMDWNLQIWYIFILLYVIVIGWIWYRKVVPFLVNESSDKSDIMGLIQNFGYLNGLDNFTQNTEIHAKIQSVGKYIYLCNLQKIIRNKQRDWVMFQYFYVFLMVYITIFGIFQSNDPIYQLAPYMLYVDIGMICMIVGLFIWNQKRWQKITQIKALGDLINHYYEDQ